MGPVSKIPFRYFAIFILLILGTACNSDGNSDQDSCSDILCTEEFVSLTVTVYNEQQEPVALDTFVVTRTDTGEEFSPEYTPEQLQNFQSAGAYPLIDDSYLPEYKRQVLLLTFTGYISGEPVAEEEYTVGFDCCHVLLAEGELEIELDLD